MKDRLYCTIAFICFQTLIFSQDFHLGLKIGGGDYQLADVKRLQTEMLDENPNLDIEAVQAFPNTPNYQFSFEYILNKEHLLGLSAEYCSTGGRNHLQDYSGEYALNMPLKGYGLAVQYRNILKANGRFNLYGQMKLGYKYSKMGIDATVVVYAVDSSSESINLIANGFYIEPNLGVLFNIFETFYLDAGIGYQVNYGQGLHLKGNKDALLKGEKYKVDWTGYRYYIGFSVMF